MNILSKTALSGVNGFFWAIILFFICFLCVHLVKLIKLGWQTATKPPQRVEKQEKKPAEGKSGAGKEPIYYIVERKKKRARSNFTEPKEFHFK